jgi:hypothetical protein
VMQVYADVLRRPLSVIVSDQGPALGSAIHAAVAAGAYPDVPAAAAVMGGKREAVYRPDPASADVYDRLYAEYLLLHDYFGRGANEVMHRLRALRDDVLSGKEGEAEEPPGYAVPVAKAGLPAVEGDSAEGMGRQGSGLAEGSGPSGSGLPPGGTVSPRASAAEPGPAATAGRRSARADGTRGGLGGSSPRASTARGGVWGGRPPETSTDGGRS